MSRRRSRARRPLLASAAVVAIAAGLTLFQPWKLVVDDVVSEALPAGLTELDPVPSGPATGAAVAGVPPAGSVAPVDPPPRPPPPPPPPAPRPTATNPTATNPTAADPGAAGPRATTAAPLARVVARGTFVSHEHATTGSVRVNTQPDGHRLLRIDDLDTSNGPDLRVWITDAPVRAGQDGWRVFDDGVHVELGRLKGNRGSQNYALPDSVDLRRLGSLSIWCDRFNVSFGAAALQLSR